MQRTLLALMLVLSVFVTANISAQADNYSGYPDWAQEAFTGADDRGPDSD